jgi:hypothetical protein
MTDNWTPSNRKRQLNKKPNKPSPAEAVELISKQMQPLLKGRPSAVQSAVLADLLSLWLAGHWPPAARKMLLADFVKLVLDLVPENEKQLFGPDGHPAGRPSKR